MGYDYFYGQSGELFAYFRIPKALFQDHRFRQLSTDARTLYGILLDRMSLSARNGQLGVFLDEHFDNARMEHIYPNAKKVTKAE